MIHAMTRACKKNPRKKNTRSGVVFGDEKYSKVLATRKPCNSCHPMAPTPSRSPSLSARARSPELYFLGARHGSTRWHPQPASAFRALGAVLHQRDIAGTGIFDVNTSNLNARTTAFLAASRHSACRDSSRYIKTRSSPKPNLRRGCN